MHRVVIVDDSDDLRFLLRATLEARPAFEVVGEAADGATAVEQAAALQPDVVLLDLSMPVMDGMAVLPLLRERTPNAVVVVLSGYDSPELRAETSQAGADGYLVKGRRPREM